MLELFGLLLKNSNPIPFNSFQKKKRKKGFEKSEILLL